MKHPLLRFLLLASAVGALLPAPSARAATPTVDIVARLGGDPDGFHPQSALVDGHDGFFYGTTEAGGPANFGTIFKVAPDGTLTTIYRFTGGEDGANPTVALVAGGDGKFYGVTSGDYPSGRYDRPSGRNPGTVFRVTPAGGLTTLHRFSAFDANGHNADGGYPRAELILGRDGQLYGTTSHGGPTDGGTVFRLALDGTLTTLATFDGTIKVVGQSDTGPDAALVQGPDGNFYGSTHLGGSAEVAGGLGRLFRMTPAGEVTTLFDFPSYDGGAYPTTALTVGRDGNLYGTLSGANSDSNAYYGGPLIFRITLAGAFTSLGHGNIVTTPQSSFSALVLGADGNFYGTGSNASMVFRITPDGTFTNLFQFPGIPGDEQTHQYFPNGLALGGDGNFYGTTRYGGYGGLTAGAGTVFQVSPTGAAKLIHLFNMGGTGGSPGRLLALPGGTLLGTTSNGGISGVGTLFAVKPTGTIATIHSFNFSTEGGYPLGGVVRDAAGNLFCATSEGGSADPASAEPYPFANVTPGLGGTFDQIIGFSEAAPTQPVQVQVLHNFDLATGAGSFSTPVPLLSADRRPVNPAVFYGATTSGGSTKDGTIYSVTAGGAYTLLHSFNHQANEGSSPVAALAEGSDGNFYGVAKYGGTPVATDPVFHPTYTVTLGTIFSITPTGTATTLYSFKGNGDGVYPDAELTLGKDGSLYGTTPNTSINYRGYAPEGNGTIFSITPAGGFKTLHTFASDGSEGSEPTALVQASDGAFYGATRASGYPFPAPNATAQGTIFSITPDGTFTLLYSFPSSGPAGSSPAGSLVQGSDGNLYGTTSTGGTDDAGAIFRVVLNPATVPPTVTLAASGAVAASGQAGGFLLTLSRPAATDLRVAYSVRGSAAPGTDYAALKGTAKIRAGQTSKLIRIVPLGSPGGTAGKTVKLTLAPGDGYTVGTAGKVKLRLPPEP